MVKLCDSRLVGVFYVVFSFLGSVLGFSLSLSLRLELVGPFSVFGDSFYFVNVTNHGLVMVFFFLTLLASGFSNYFLPHMCFLEDMSLPRINLLSLWLVLISFVFVALSLVLGEGVSSGWTLYVPLSSILFNSSCSIDLAITSIHLFSLSSLLGAFNIIVTSVFSFSNSFSLFSLSPFIFGYVTTSFLVLFSTPSLSCVLTFLLLDRVCGTYYFVYEFGGDPVLYQVMFWVWGHPEVYILVLPVFSVISQMIHSTCGFILNKVGIISSMLSLSILSFLVWGHHMVSTGWGIDLKSYFMSSTVVISIPTSVKVFSWLFSLLSCQKEFSISTCCLGLFILFFSVGGSTGLFLANSSLDLLFHDGYFVVGHFHFVLVNASILGFSSGFFFYFHNFFCYVLIFSLSIWFCASFSFHLLVLFTPFHLLGYLGFPRRVCSYSMDSYVYMYFSSVSFLGIWSNYFIFLLGGLLSLCGVFYEKTTYYANDF